MLKNSGPSEIDSLMPGAGDLLAEPARRRGPPRATIALWLVAISMVIFFLPLFLISSAVGENVKGMQTDLTLIRVSLTNVPTPLPEVKNLLSTLTQAQSQSNQVNRVQATLSANRPDWSAVMTALGNYNPDQLTIASVSRADNRLTLTGRAVRDEVVTTYVHMLERSGLFTRVTLQSIQLVSTPVMTPTITPTGTITPTATTTLTPTPTWTLVPSVVPSLTPTPSATASPTNTPVPTAIPTNTLTPIPTATPTLIPTATFTPDLRDPYEPDDYLPKSIALSQTQGHNFYPSGDIDVVTFLAKGGHFYRVFTSDLVPGVDTTLAVQIGGANFTNDDASAGNLSSEIRFQNVGGDTLAVVSIANRGDFGSDKWYKLTVQEYLPTPTSTAMPPATVTPTVTRTPTTNPPSATPNLRDTYEPDETTAKAIAIGENQTHSFYPDGDVDKISFGAKALRYYQVLTSSLALGVDTAVSVALNGKQWTNDDYAAPGSGNFASAVCFQAPVDGTPIATISNLGQFGSSKTYQVKVTEVASLTAAPCLAPTTPSAMRPSKPSLLKPAAAPTVIPTLAATVDPTGVRFVIIVELKAATP